jgi:hypothetical protein
MDPRFPHWPAKQRPYLPVCSVITKDNLIGLVALKRDAQIGQYVSYYRITIDFRQEGNQSACCPRLTLESAVRMSSIILVNQDPLELNGDVTHLFVLAGSQSLTSALGTVTLHTDDSGNRKSSMEIWDIRKSTTALHATFSQLSIVSNIPAPRDEAVRTCSTKLTIVFHFVEAAM